MARRVRPLMEKCGHTSFFWCMVAFRLAAREALVAETVQAGAAKPSPDVAAEYADRLASALSVK